MQTQTHCSELYRALLSVPRHQMHQFCRKNGEHSWLCNANRNPNYKKYANVQGAQ